MARFLSRTLIGGHPSHLLSAARSPLLPIYAARLVNFRGRSHRPGRDPEAAESGEVEVEVEVEVIGVRRLEDAIHSIIIRRSAPDWLPFIPGSSYWVPPRKQAHRVAEIIENLAANPLTEEETLSFMTNRGWPSSSHFVEGISPHRVKRKPKKATAESDDEEEAL